MTLVREVSPSPLQSPILQGSPDLVSVVWSNWFEAVSKNLYDLTTVLGDVMNEFCTRSRCFGKVASPTATNWGSISTITPFRVISGNNAYGTDTGDEAQLVGSADTPIITGMTGFTIHSIIPVAASATSVFRVRLVYGTGTMNDAISAGYYSESFVRVSSDSLPTGRQWISLPVLTAGTQVWAQAWNATNDAWLDFNIVIHEYDT